MKNLAEKIHEGFFDNVNANPFKALDDFLKKNKNSIVTLKGKDYLIHNLLIFDIKELRNVVGMLLDRATIEKNKDLKKYREITNVEWNDSGGFGMSVIVITYKFYSLTNIEKRTEPLIDYYRFAPVTKTARGDEYLIDFLKKIAK